MATPLSKVSLDSSLSHPTSHPSVSLAGSFSNIYPDSACSSPVHLVRHPHLLGWHQCPDWALCSFLCACAGYSHTSSQRDLRYQYNVNRRRRMPLCPASTPASHLTQSKSLKSSMVCLPRLPPSQAGPCSAPWSGGTFSSPSHLCFYCARCLHCLHCPPPTYLGGGSLTSFRMYFKCYLLREVFSGWIFKIATPCILSPFSVLCFSTPHLVTNYIFIIYCSAYFLSLPQTP